MTKLICLILLMVAGFIIGARGIHFLMNRSLYETNLYDLFSLTWQNFGLIGGVFGASILGSAVAKLFKFNFWAVGDAGTKGFAIGFVVMRIGCYFNGCCFGKPSNVLWAKSYAMLSSTHIIQYEKYNNILPKAVHPTQLYEILVVLLAVVLSFFYSKKHSSKGQFAVSFMICFILGRWFVLGFREMPQASDYHTGMTILYLCLTLLLVSIAVRRQQKLKSNEDV